MLSEKIIAGMDEAGRGAWAGPVVAAAVILPKWAKLPQLTDSKLLSARQRDELFDLITAKCEHSYGLATHEEVDKHGLLHATFLAYKRALEKLPVKPDHLMIDGKDKFEFEIPHTSIIKGDQKIRSISAASIIAQVTRDRMMLDYAREFPQYGFEAHKGYGTKRHQCALKENGPIEIHRKSYSPLQKIKWEQKAFL
jgi:ribonuclease HII